MAAFDYSAAPHPVRPEIVSAHQAFWDRLAGPGSWWTAEQRIAIAEEARAMRPLRKEPPWLRKLVDPTEGVVPAIVIEAVRTICLDAHQIDAAWCGRMVDALGDAAYVEMVSIAVQTTAVDAFAEAVGVDPEPVPSVRDAGTPNESRPEGLGDIGAFVPMQLAYPGPNVGRAMSLAPEDNGSFFGLVGSMYAVADFMELVWKDRPLTRPQVELVAARVSAINECFY